MMHLIVDIGNTRTKWAVVAPSEGFVAEGVDELCEELLDGLAERYPISRAIISTTRGEMEREVALLRKWVGYVLPFDTATSLPIAIDYSTPETLGRDRVAAAVGAEVLYPNRNCLVVDFGTALTIDLVTADGTFRGGVISLGLTTRFKALEHFTAKLPLCSPSDSDAIVGRSTREAIEQGVMQSITFELEGYIARHRAKNEQLCVIFTGGEAKYFVKRIKNTIFAESNLVFIGLNRILEYNATKNR